MLAPHIGKAIKMGLKIAVIGQSAFGAEVFKELKTRGHEIVGVFTIPDTKGREDPLATAAKADNLQVFKFPRWKALKKDGGHTLPEVEQQFKLVGADLSVLAFVTQFIPVDLLDSNKYGGIIYHPSILPRHRGASAINWTLMQGDKKTGLTVFWADDGLDTGPILLQRETDVEPDDTVNSLYKRFLFPDGVKAVGDAVDLIAAGTAPRIVQPTEGATYDPLWKDPVKARVDFDKTGQEIHDFIRGNDRVPGAWAVINGQETTLYGSTRTPPGGIPTEGKPVEIEGSKHPGLVTGQGLVLTGSDGEKLMVTSVKVGGKSLPAANLLGESSDGGGAKKEAPKVDETAARAAIEAVWKDILGVDTISSDTDFFAQGAGSLDATRLVENLQSSVGLVIDPEDIYRAPTYADFVKKVLNTTSNAAEYTTVKVKANGLELSLPVQHFIGGRFVDGLEGKTRPTINPATEEVIVEVADGGAADVDAAVTSAKDAFDNGEWRKISARDRGKLLMKLADLMEQNKEELATIESLDSGAVYTLAVKTHVGMSIDTFLYFAGLADKIEGRTIPINDSRPSKNLCFTRREPIGVVGLIVPWNYPLMMVAWKAAACLAAGNTVVLKPAEVTPLTALKFAELTLKAGFPRGVVNVVLGAGSVVGAAITDHPLIRKVGFTGSTPVGKLIMGGAAKNLKKVSLELGGKSPLIIFADADFDRAVRQAGQAVFFNKGENCIAAGRIFVEASVHDKFVEAVVSGVRKMKIGDPLDRTTVHGPQNHKAHFDKLVAYVETAVKEGATLVYGGKRVGTRGFFLEPAVITGVEDGTVAATEESFGPIMLISKFETLDEVLKRANATEYGLASGVFTQDLNKALKVADGLQAGTVYVNTYNKTDVASPFGGWKQSGFGKDLGQEALDEYLRTKAVTVEYW